MGTTSTPTKLKTPWLWPLLLVIAGVVLLLDNFLLLGDFNAWALAPLLLVIAGAQILLRGDFVFSAEGKPFSITRGSVESATLEISSGAVDVDVQGLQREGRLIAGQFGWNARPALRTEGNYVYLRMERAAVPWFSLADWQARLARDLPWQIFISTHLGRINLDLSGVIVQEVVAASGIGDIHFTLPVEALGGLYLRSTLGDVYITAPAGSRARIVIRSTPLTRLRVDDRRYAEVTPGVYETLDADADGLLTRLEVVASFGDVLLL